MTLMSLVGKTREKVQRQKPWLSLKGSKFSSLVEDLKVVNLGGKEKAKEIWVGEQMSSDLRQKLIKLLREYANIFAWSYRDMLGLYSNIIEHKLPLLPNVVWIQQ
ncbi:hypothetical protein CR513_25531, partial [Mucuna pruriens]